MRNAQPRVSDSPFTPPAHPDANGFVHKRGLQTCRIEPRDLPPGPNAPIMRLNLSQPLFLVKSAPWHLSRRGLVRRSLIKRCSISNTCRSSCNLSKVRTHGHLKRTRPLSIGRYRLYQTDTQRTCRTSMGSQVQKGLIQNPAIHAGLADQTDAQIRPRLVPGAATTRTCIISCLSPRLRKTSPNRFFPFAK